MTTMWSAAEAPRADRAAAVREAVGSNVVRVDIDLPDDPGQIDVELALSEAGPVQVLTVRSMATTVTRSPRLARDGSEPHLFLTLQATGGSTMAQHGRYAHLRPGQFAVYTTTSPYTLAFDRGLDAHFFRIPIAEVALPASAIQEVSARTLGDHDPVAALTSTYLRRLAASPGLRKRAVADSLAQPTIDLVRAALVSSLGDPGLGRESLQTTLEMRLLEHMRAHLADAASVRTASPRRTTSPSGTSTASLAAPASRSATGSARTGWRRAAASSPSRTRGHGRSRRSPASGASRTRRTSAGSFREAYGMTPREWRALRTDR